MRIPQRARVRGGLIALAAAVLLSGCGGKRAHGPGPAEPRRVVCASPAVAEIVFALGCGDRVVGVSEFTDWPPAAAAKSSIGGALSPSRERILALEPDLILAQGKAEALAEFARGRGIAFRALPLDTLEDVRNAMAGIAAVLGAEKEGKALWTEMEREFAALERREPVSVFIALGHAPGDFSGLMTTGAGTFLDDIVARAGGSNAFFDLQAAWPKVSLEALVRRHTALVLDIQSVAGDEARRIALVADWGRFGFAPDQIRVLEEESVLRPGPRAARAAQIVSQAIWR